MSRLASQTVVIMGHQQTGWSGWHSCVGERRRVEKPVDPQSPNDIPSSPLANKGIPRALPDSEQRFAKFMQFLPGLAWIKDLDGRYVFVNDAAERAFGKPRGELYGRTDEEIFPPETAAQFRVNDRKVLATG